MLVWLDLEMTGLDPASHAIVEIATLITTDDLHIVAEGPNLVVHQPPEVLEGMDEVVLSMHTRSGLIYEIAKSSISVEAAGRATLDFLKQHLGHTSKVPLCGSSIGTDRRFLARYLPDVEDFLHYRSVDVSTLKELLRRWNPTLYGQRPRKSNTHRALDDIHESLSELRWYRDIGFIGLDGHLT